MNRVAAAPAALLLSVALLLSSCDSSGPNPDPTGDPTSSAPSASSSDQSPGLDEATAAQLVIARYDAVHALPPTPSDEVDVQAAGDGVVAPGSTEADRVAGALNQAIELGVLDRGDVLVEALERPSAVGDDAATASLCMSQDLRTTDLETGEEAGAAAPPNDWLRIEADFERVDGTWLVTEIRGADPTACVPPSIEAETGPAWDVFAAARVEHESRGGGPDIGEMESVVTERFAETLRSIGPFDPPAVEPPGYTGFKLTEATRSSAEGWACRDDELETVEWELVSGQWLIDFAGQTGEEASPCP
jgi:hypothetical protein